jgi:hypothetical protein
MNRVLLFLICLFMTTRLPAMELTATLSTNKLLVGDRVVLTVTTTHEAGDRSLIPSIANEPFIVVWDEQSRQEKQSDQRQKTITEITFSSFVIGETPGRDQSRRRGAGRWHREIHAVSRSADFRDVGVEQSPTLPRGH